MLGFFFLFIKKIQKLVPCHVKLLCYTDTLLIKLAIFLIQIYNSMKMFFSNGVSHMLKLFIGLKLTSTVDKLLCKTKPSITVLQVSAIYLPFCNIS